MKNSKPRIAKLRAEVEQCRDAAEKLAAALELIALPITTSASMPELLQTMGYDIYIATEALAAYRKLYPKAD